MGNRRKAREMAMQALFFMDISKDVSVGQIELFCRCYPPPQNIDAFFRKLIFGFLETRSAIDEIIEKHSSNWKLHRMACVDRNILRVAAYELLFCKDIPAKVTINEAVDIAKKFGTESSGAFINGILDSIRDAADRGEISIDHHHLFSEQ